MRHAHVAYSIRMHGNIILKKSHEKSKFEKIFEDKWDVRCESSTVVDAFGYDWKSSH